MTLDRKDYKSAIPQLESRLQQLEKVGRELTNKFDDIAHQTQLDAAEAEKRAASIDFQIDTIQVVMEYALVANGFEPSATTQWSTEMPTLDASTSGMTLWYRSATYRNGIVVQTTEPQTVNIMDGVYAFVNSVSGNYGWTTIDGDKIQTGSITSHNGYCYFDIDNNNFQMKNASTLADSTSALAWDNGQLYVKGKIAIGNSTSDRTYYTEMTGGGFDIVANNVPLAHIGYAYASGASVSSYSPYYTFGTRATGSGLGAYSMAEGVNVTASKYCAHAEGCLSKATEQYAHAEGYNTTASGYYSHAEGYETEAYGQYSHAEGNDTHAMERGAHAGGNSSTANHVYSFVHGQGLTTGTAYQTIFGTYNTVDSTKAFIVATGDSGYPENGFAVDWDGKITVQNHSSPIGTVITIEGSSSTSDISCTSDVAYNIGSISLPAGSWVVTARARFTPTASGTHYSSVNFSTESQNDSTYDRRYGEGTAINQHSITVVAATTATTTYYLCGVASVAGKWVRANRAAYTIRAMRIA